MIFEVCTSVPLFQTLEMLLDPILEKSVKSIENV